MILLCISSLSHKSLVFSFWYVLLHCERNRCAVAICEFVGVFDCCTTSMMLKFETTSMCAILFFFVATLSQSDFSLVPSRAFIVAKCCGVRMCCQCEYAWWGWRMLEYPKCSLCSPSQLQPIRLNNLCTLWQTLDRQHACWRGQTIHGPGANGGERRTNGWTWCEMRCGDAVQMYIWEKSFDGQVMMMRTRCACDAKHMILGQMYTLLM